MINASIELIRKTMGKKNLIEIVKIKNHRDQPKSVMCFKDFQSILQISDHVHRGIWENFEI
jgi:hypothetical protein